MQGVERDKVMVLEARGRLAAGGFEPQLSPCSPFTSLTFARDPH